ncbi:MAG: hypothetical protein NVS2B5_08720 [Beijerinckiaceae bacterium]
MSETAARWRRDLLSASARVEAELDFSDEGDVTTLVAAEVIADVRKIASEISAVLAKTTTGERAREGVRVVIAGVANAGKSTLLNALARREVAIVSAQPGTTRDAIEVRLDLAGFPLSLTDTAGMRPSEDPVEQIGIARAKSHAARADLVLWLMEPGSRAFPPASMEGRGEVWTIATKCDLGGTVNPDVKLAVSAATGEGLRELEQALQHFARDALEPGGEAASVTSERHRRALAEAAAALDRITAQPNLPTDIVAEELRIAQNAIGRIAGRIDSEEVLGEIFGRFCIGK